MRKMITLLVVMAIATMFGCAACSVHADTNPEAVVQKQVSRKSMPDQKTEAETETELIFAPAPSKTFEETTAEEPQQEAVVNTQPISDQPQIGEAAAIACEDTTMAPAEAEIGEPAVIVNDEPVPCIGTAAVATFDENGELIVTIIGGEDTPSVSYCPDEGQIGDAAVITIDDNGETVTSEECQLGDAIFATIGEDGSLNVTVREEVQ